MEKRGYGTLEFGFRWNYKFHWHAWFNVHLNCLDPYPLVLMEASQPSNVCLCWFICLGSPHLAAPFPIKEKKEALRSISPRIFLRYQLIYLFSYLERYDNKKPLERIKEQNAVTPPLHHVGVITNVSTNLLCLYLIKPKMADSLKNEKWQTFVLEGVDNGDLCKLICSSSHQPMIMCFSEFWNLILLQNGIYNSWSSRKGNRTWACDLVLGVDNGI